MHHKLTDDVQQRLVESLQAGNFITTAARAAGIGERTFYDWMNRGRRELERCDATECQPDEREAPFVAFYQTIGETQAAAEETLVTIVRNAAVDTWQAGAWLLERKHPDRYGAQRRVMVQVEHELERALERLKAKLPAHAYEEVLAALAADEDAELLGESQAA